MIKPRIVRGFSSVKKATMMNSDDQTQTVLVTDGHDATVVISLSTSSYPAILGVDEALALARDIVASANRARTIVASEL